MLYKDKWLLASPHHTEFVQTVSKVGDITSRFYSLQYLQMPWTGLEGVSDEHILNKSTEDSLEIICSFDFHSYIELCCSHIFNGLRRFILGFCYKY